MFDDGKDTIPILMDCGYLIKEHPDDGYKEISMKCNCGSTILVKFIPNIPSSYLYYSDDNPEKVPKYYYCQFLCPLCGEQFRIPNAQKIISIVQENKI